MATYKRKFSFELITPEGPVCQTQAVQVVLPAVDGMMGVLGGHAPLMAMLGAGALTLEEPQTPPRQYYVEGGYAIAREDAVTVLAEKCLPPESLNEQSAGEELLKARQSKAVTSEALTQRDEAVSAARAKLRMARRGKGSESRDSSGGA